MTRPNVLLSKQRFKSVSQEEPLEIRKAYVGFQFVNRFKTLFAAMLLLQSVIASADPSDLETLDLILTRAGGIRAMIANPTARQEYFEALGRFGIKINLTSYDALLTSVTEAMDAFPGMEARLMQTEGLGTKLVLEIGSKSYGVTLKPKEFYEGYRNWIESLTEGFSLSRDDAILRLYRLSSDIDAFERDFKGNRKQRDLARREFFQNTVQSPTYQELFGFLKAKRMNAPDIRGRHLTEDTSEIIELFSELRDGKQYDLIDGISIPENVRGLVAAHKPFDLTVPLLVVNDGKPAESAYFKVMTRETRNGIVPVGVTGPKRVEFHPSPRRFHGIFKGFLVKECVAGDCRRYLTVTLKDTELFFVDLVSPAAGTRSLNGFVQIVPVHSEDKTRILGAVDLMASALTQVVRSTDPGSRKTRSQTVLELWLDRYTSHLAPGFHGLILGNTNAMANAGVLPTANRLLQERGSFSLVMGPLKPIDTDAQRFLSKMPDNSYTGPPPGNFIFEAGTPGNTQIRGFSNLVTEDIVRKWDLEKFFLHLKAWNSSSDSSRATDRLAQAWIGEEKNRIAVETLSFEALNKYGLTPLPEPIATTWIKHQQKTRPFWQTWSLKTLLKKLPDNRVYLDPLPAAILRDWIADTAHQAELFKIDAGKAANLHVASVREAWLEHQSSRNPRKITEFFSHRRENNTDVVLKYLVPAIKQLLVRPDDQSLIANVLSVYDFQQNPGLYEAFLEVAHPQQVGLILPKVRIGALSPATVSRLVASSNDFPLATALRLFAELSPLGERPPKEFWTRLISGFNKLWYEDWKLVSEIGGFDPSFKTFLDQHAKTLDGLARHEFSRLFGPSTTDDLIQVAQHYSFRRYELPNEEVMTEVFSALDNGDSQLWSAFQKVYSRYPDTLSISYQLPGMKRAILKALARVPASKTLYKFAQNMKPVPENTPEILGRLFNNPKQISNYSRIQSLIAVYGLEDQLAREVLKLNHVSSETVWASFFSGNQKFRQAILQHSKGNPRYHRLLIEKIVEAALDGDLDMRAFARKGDIRDPKLRALILKRVRENLVTKPGRPSACFGMPDCIVDYAKLAPPDITNLGLLSSTTEITKSDAAEILSMRKQSGDAQFRGLCRKLVVKGLLKDAGPWPRTRHTFRGKAEKLVEKLRKRFPSK